MQVSLRHRFRRTMIQAYEAGLRRRPTFRYLDRLEQSQWWPDEELEQARVEGLRRLLLHSVTHCSYFRDLWAPLGLRPDSIQSLTDLRHWPITSREEINQHRASMCSRSCDRLLSKATGGSSGVPLGFFMDQDSVDRRMAAWHRGYAWAGAGVGTRQWYFWGVPLGARALHARVKDRLYHGLYNRLVASSFGYTDEDASGLATELGEYRPDAIVAYVNPLFEFARALEQRNIKPFSPRAIVVGAEKLHGFQRELISRVFRAPVFETYGSREFMLIGAECEHHSGLHTTAEHLIVEIVDDHGRPVADGEEGDLLITDLFNFGMPFIRYRIGDRGRMSTGTCLCGRNLPRLAAVTGRKLDVIRTRDRRIIAGEFFPHLLKDFPAIRRFQVVQRSVDNVEVLVVPGDGWEPTTRTAMHGLIQQTLGDSCALTIREVPDIPLTAAGKRRVVVSDVAVA